MVRNIVIVHHDGETETLPVEALGAHPPRWLYRLYRGDVRKAFVRDGSAFREFGSEENRYGETTESTIVYLERPLSAYHEERDRVERASLPEEISRETERLERCRESAIRDLADMPLLPVWVS